MGSRIRDNPEHIFELFCEVVIPSTCNENAWILQKFPDHYNDEEILKSVPEFSYPCEYVNNAVQHFSFVLTSIDSKWTFGYCRHAPNSQTYFVLISFLPWHETFYKLLNHVAELAYKKDSGELGKFLEALYEMTVPEPGLQLHVIDDHGKSEFVSDCPDHHKLQSIPQSRNLTEYYNAIDTSNMMIIFASMLHERRILITSKKLSRLSACVQAANSLIYPMHWQHIFIPVLPNHLLDYLSAPMPFLIGVPAATMTRVKRSELGEVVLLDADNNRVVTPFEDLQMLPPEIVSSLKRSLKNPNSMLGDGVARAFLRALVQLIGGYRDALKLKPGEKISFSHEAFIQSRPASMQVFLEKMLHLQLFQQFIEGRLDMLNSGHGFNDEFEFEVNMYEDKASNRLRMQYKEWVTAMKKEGGAFLKTVKSKANPAMKYAYKSVKDRSKRAYKDIRSKIHEMQHTKLSADDFGMPPAMEMPQPRSAPSSPTHQRKVQSFRRVQNSMTFSRERKGGHEILREVDSNDIIVELSKPKHASALNVDEVAIEALDDSSDTESGAHLNFQRIDMDLMGDLQDLIFQKCSLLTDGENNVTHSSRLAPPVDRTLKPRKSFDSALSAGSPTPREPVLSKSFPIPAPVPPPRQKRRNVVASPARSFSDTPCSRSLQTTDGTPDDTLLIRLDSLEDDDNFDPLKRPTSNSLQQPSSTFAATPDVSLNAVPGMCYTRPGMARFPASLPNPTYFNPPVNSLSSPHQSPFHRPVVERPHTPQFLHTTHFSAPTGLPVSQLHLAPARNNVPSNFAETVPSPFQTTALLPNLPSASAVPYPSQQQTLTQCPGVGQDPFTDLLTGNTWNGQSASPQHVAATSKSSWQQFN